MNATFEIARDLGWDYFVKLAAQNVMQVQSATDTPKRISLGERAVMVDGAGYLVIRYKEAGQPVDSTAHIENACQPEKRHPDGAGQKLKQYHCRCQTEADGVAQRIEIGAQIAGHTGHAGDATV